MTRKLSLPIFLILFVSALTVTGCGSGAEVELESSDAQTQAELDEAAEYDAAMNAAAEETAKQGN